MREKTMTNRKIFIVICTTLMIAALSACGSSKTSGSANVSKNSNISEDENTEKEETVVFIT